MPVNLNPNIVESPILNVLDRGLSAPYHSHLYNLSSSIAGVGITAFNVVRSTAKSSV
jgi:hypothetical protein